MTGPQEPVAGPAVGPAVESVISPLIVVLSHEVNGARHRAAVNRGREREARGAGEDGPASTYALLANEHDRYADRFDRIRRAVQEGRISQ